MNRLVKRIMSLTLAGTMLVSMGGLGQAVTAAEESIVNIGVTNSLGGMNPLVMDQTEVNVHAMGHRI